MEEANETLFHLYEFSPYRVARAMEEKHTELSARLVGRLKEMAATHPDGISGLVDELLRRALNESGA